jgi:hypothetical protein
MILIARALNADPVKLFAKIARSANPEIQRFLAGDHPPSHALPVAGRVAEVCKELDVALVSCLRSPLMNFREA